MGGHVSTLRVEPTDSNDTGVCECCGNRSRVVGGFVYRDEEPAAAYFVHWTLGRPDHGANFDFILGRWGEGTGPGDRSVASLVYGLMENGPPFMVVDAAGRPAADSAIASRFLRREDVIGTAAAGELFAFVDAVWLQDGRIGELIP